MTAITSPHGGHASATDQSLPTLQGGQIGAGVEMNDPVERSNDGLMASILLGALRFYWHYYCRHTKESLPCWTNNLYA